MKNRLVYLSEPKYMVGALLLVLVAIPAHGFRVVDGSLGNWLEREASPKLVELLIRHPRLKGQRLKIMGIENGTPVALGNKLGANIKDQLTQDLLSQTGIRLVFDEHVGCNPDKTRLVLGIVTQRHDRTRHRVTVAMVDVEEGLWLGGANFSWSGRLSESQRQAFNTHLSGNDKRNVLNVHEANLIADALGEQIDCLPTIESPVYFQLESSQLEQNVVQGLRTQFNRRSRVVSNQAEARSVLQLKLAPLPGNVSTLSLMLAPADTPELTRQIAWVQVSGNVRGTLPVGVLSGERRGRYLSELHIDPEAQRHGNGRCVNSSLGCVRVDYELYRPAYIVAFYTRDGVPVPLNCKLGVERKAGRHQIKVQVPHGGELNRPTLGVYTLAFSQRGPAEILQRELNLGAPSCSARPSDPDIWVSSFARALSRYEGRLEWRALHLMRDRNGVTRL